MTTPETRPSAERWRPVVGWEGLYEVSSEGRVRRGGRVMRGSVTHRGYRRVCLSGPVGRAYRPVHQLVLEAFSGPRPEGCEASHVDGCKLNNRSDNLVWETSKENHARRPGHGTGGFGEDNSFARLTARDVLEIRSRRKDGESFTSISRGYPVGRDAIRMVCHKETWEHV